MKIRQTNIHKISELKEVEKYSFQKAIKEELTEDQKKWMEYLNQFIKESGRGPRGFFVKLKTGEYLELEEYNKWIVEMKDKYKNS